MYIEQMYTGCLSEAAYYIESNGEAVIIDPLRETIPYIELAKSRNAKIKYIFETHFHADFVSGHIDLARKTGATIVYGPNAKPEYEVHVAEDNELIKVGDLTFKVLHTPGHTMESSCYLLLDKDGKEHALFSGDTLFVGDVGRPDLAVKSDPPVTREDLAGVLYDSLRKKVMTLPDEVILYPAHGPGSSCGKKLGDEKESTIGRQKKTNYALQEMSKEEFVKQLTDGLLPPPAYFFEDARINIEGYDNIDDVMGRNLKSLTIEEVVAATDSGALILDTRFSEEFEKGFIPGAFNIGTDGSFASWVGTLINIEKQLIIVSNEGREEETILRLARVGFENVLGYLEGGMKTWEASGKEMDTVTSISVAEFKSKQEAGDINILDVRNYSEIVESRVKGSKNIPLGFLQKNLASLDTDKTYFIHCLSGYRSMIASSILKANGYKNLVNVWGGFEEIEGSGIPLESGEIETEMVM